MISSNQFNRTIERDDRRRRRRRRMGEEGGGSHATSKPRQKVGIFGIIGIFPN